MSVTRALLQATPTPFQTAPTTPSPSPSPVELVEEEEAWKPFEWLPYVDLLGSFYRLLLALFILGVAVYVSRLTRQVMGRRIARRFKRPSVSRTILRGIQTVIIGIGVIMGLGVFGFGFENLALSVGVFSAVAGIILAPIIGNVLSGFFILSEQPYEIGDMIRIEDTDTHGFVEEITLLYTKIFTLDNTFMVMPNGSMRDRDIVNFSAEDTRIRRSLEVGVTYESDIPTARAQLEAAAREVEGVIKGGPDIRIGSARYPAAPTCYIREFGDSDVLLRLRYWAKEPYKQTKLRSHVLTNAWRRFDEHDIEIPYPHQHMVFDDTSGELQVATREVAEGARAQAGGATARAADDELEPDRFDDAPGAEESSAEGSDDAPGGEEPSAEGSDDAPGGEEPSAEGSDDAPGGEEPSTEGTDDGDASEDEVPDVDDESRREEG